MLCAAGNDQSASRISLNLAAVFTTIVAKSAVGSRAFGRKIRENPRELWKSATIVDRSVLGRVIGDDIERPRVSRTCIIPDFVISAIITFVDKRLVSIWQFGGSGGLISDFYLGLP